MESEERFEYVRRRTPRELNKSDPYLETIPNVNSRQFHDRLIRMGTKSSKKLLRWLMTANSSQKKIFMERIRKLNFVINDDIMSSGSKKDHSFHEPKTNPKSKRSERQHQHVDNIEDE